MKNFPTIETTFLFKGPAGNIEVIATPAKVPAHATKTAIICHPHPLFGGTMKNKVVSTLARAFSDLGLRTVRFNFRGVGKSEGMHDEGRGELDDLLALVQWVKESFPGEPFWLAGFSFGAYIATKAATKLNDTEQLVTIAPQVSRFKQDDLSGIACPWLLIQGEEDEVVSPQEVYAWVETLNPQPHLIRMAGAGHFFHGKLLELRQILVDTLEK